MSECTTRSHLDTAPAPIDASPPPPAASANTAPHRVPRDRQRQRLQYQAAIIDWYPDPRVAHTRTGHRLEAEHGELFQRLDKMLGDEGGRFCFVADCSGLQHVSAGARDAAASFFDGHRERAELWVFGLGAVTTVMARLFFRFTGIRGGIVHDLDEAARAAGLGSWHPDPPADHVA